MDLNISYKKVNLLAIIGILLHILLITIAMFTYPGGMRDNPAIQGYSFWGNTFSDLGRTRAWNGESNLISMILFTLAYGTQIITIIPFYLKFIRIFLESKIEMKISKIGSYFGITSSVAFIGILFTPADILNEAHWVFVFIGYPSILIMGVCYSVTIILSDKFNKMIKYVFTAIFIIFFIALLVGLIGVSFNRTIMVIGQKIMTFALLIDFSILIYSAWNLHENIDSKVL
jgi:hypothetical protein